MTTPFVALSYNWGDSKDTLPITCNGGSLNITRSLHGFLSALRARGAFGYLWADGICIDQGNPDEQGTQIPLMYKLYRYASRVIVWLGDTARDIEVSAPIIPLLAQASRGPPVDATTMTPQNWAMLGLGMPQAELSQRIRGIYRLLKRPWFRRVWIIQEYAAAKQVIFLCGGYELEDETLYSAIGFLESSRLQLRFGPAWHENPLVWLRMARAEQDAGVRAPLLQVLERFRTWNSTKGRDKVYALLGFASDAGADGLGIRVNTKIEPAELFKQVAIKQICSSGNLDVVTLAGIHFPALIPEVKEPRERNAALPSWVPDWHLPDGTVSVPIFTAHMMAGAGNIFPSTQQPAYQFQNLNITRFQASRETRYMPRFTPDQNGLIVRAMILPATDTVSIVGLPRQAVAEIPQDWEADPDPVSAFDRVLADIDRINDYLTLIRAEANQRYFTGELMIDVFWQTMLAGQCHLRPWHQERADFFAWLDATATIRSLCRSLASHRHLRMGVAAVYDAYKRATGGYAGFKARPFTEKISGFAGNKVIFMTNGGYVGLTAAGTKQGDVVAIVEGACCPLVLRPKGWNWEVVCGAYVHGVMQGERYDASSCRELVLV